MKKDLIPKRLSGKFILPEFPTSIIAVMNGLFCEANNVKSLPAKAFLRKLLVKNCVNTQQSYSVIVFFQHSMLAE